MTASDSPIDSAARPRRAVNSPLAQAAILTGVVLLAAVTVRWGDPLLQWQPLPADLPSRAPIAWLSAAGLSVGAILFALPRHRRAGAALMTAQFAAWTILLHLPRVAGAPLNVGRWLGLAEIGAIALGCAVWGMAPDDGRRRALAIGLGLCALVFGTSHFAYPEITASMVPQWIGAAAFWALATGAAHIAAGLALISGVLRPLAASLLATMMALFVVLLHIPRVIADASNRIEWTMLAIALTLTGAAASVAAAARGAQER